MSIGNINFLYGCNISVSVPDGFISQLLTMDPKFWTYPLRTECESCTLHKLYGAEASLLVQRLWALRAE